MATPFEFRLLGADAPDGQLDADQLIGILTSLRAIATRLGRSETASAAKGRPSRDVERVAKLRIGMLRGSTRLTVERRVDADTLDFDLADEEAVDLRFVELIEGVAMNRRPDWVSASLADGAADLVGALQKAAPEVEFRVAGMKRTSFSTAELSREPWQRMLPAEVPESITMVGRLEAVDLRSGSFRIRDDIGNPVRLPRVSDAERASHLVAEYVRVEGAPEVGSDGLIAALRDARLELADNPIGATVVRSPVSLEEILGSANGPDYGGVRGLTDDEADEFFSAVNS